MWFVIGAVVGVLLGVWIGWILRGVHVMLRMSQDPDGMRELIKEIEALDLNIRKEAAAKRLDEFSEGKERVETVVEHLGGVYYLFSKDSDQFLGQGSSIELALDEASKRWPNKVFWHTVSEQSNHTA